VQGGGKWRVFEKTVRFAIMFYLLKKFLVVSAVLQNYKNAWIVELLMKNVGKLSLIPLGVIMNFWKIYWDFLGLSIIFLEAFGLPKKFSEFLGSKKTPKILQKTMRTQYKNIYPKSTCSTQKENSDQLSLLIFHWNCQLHKRNNNTDQVVVFTVFITFTSTLLLMCSFFCSLVVFGRG
jgi:hypothetical protein